MTTTTTCRWWRVPRVFSKHTRPHEHVLSESSALKSIPILATTVMAQGNQRMTPAATAVRSEECEEYGDHAAAERGGEDHCTSTDQWQ